MATIDIKDAKGEKTGTAELNPSVFGIEPNVPVMHLAVRAQRASWRQGTHDTKTRGEVRGGGTVFGPHPRSYEMKVNKKEIKLAMRSALSAKLADNQLMVVADWNFEKPCTKDAVAALKALGIEGRATLVIGNEDINTYKSFRNIPTVTIVPVCMINTYDFLDNKTLVLTESTLARIEEVLA